jgi:hypothetical protein
MTTLTKEEKRIRPASERQLSNALLDYGDFEVWRKPREIWTAFGWWFLEQVPLENWTPEVCRDCWYRWWEEVQGIDPFEITDTQEVA